MPIGEKDLGKAEDWVRNKRLVWQMSFWRNPVWSINRETWLVPSPPLTKQCGGCRTQLSSTPSRQATESHPGKCRSLVHSILKRNLSIQFPTECPLLSEPNYKKPDPWISSEPDLGSQLHGCANRVTSICLVTEFCLPGDALLQSRDLGYSLTILFSQESLSPLN